VSELPLLVISGALSARDSWRIAIVKESLAIAAAVVGDVVQRVLNVLEIDAVVYRSTAASARMCCWRYGLKLASLST